MSDKFALDDLQEIRDGIHEVEISVTSRKQVCSKHSVTGNADVSVRSQHFLCFRVKRKKVKMKLSGRAAYILHDLNRFRTHDSSSPTHPLTK